MTKKTTYVATDAAGVQHTRKSARVYTHAVAFLPCADRAIEGAKSVFWKNQDGRNYDYYASCVALGHHKNLMSFEHYRNDPARQAQDVMEAREKIGNSSRTAYVLQEEQDRLSSINKNIEDGYYQKWQIAGFCGRYDLAQRLAAQNIDNAHVEILPAVAR